MQFKSMKGNIVYAVVLFAVMISVLYIEMIIREKIAMELNYLYRIVYISIGYPIIGAMFGLPSLWKQFNREGLWKVNAPRIIFLGFPSFILANFILAIALFSSEWIQTLAPKYSMLLSMSDVFTYVFQILFGFVLVTSFYKKENTPVNVEKTHKESSPLKGTL